MINETWYKRQVERQRDVIKPSPGVDPEIVKAARAPKNGDVASARLFADSG
jgi:hypothetical protein